MSGGPTRSRAAGDEPSRRLCPICAPQTRAVFDFLVQRQYQIVRSPSEQAAFGASRGLCSFHMWLLQQVGDPLSLSKALAPVAERWAEDIQRRLADPNRDAAAALASAVPDARSCPVCGVQREIGTAEVLRTAAALATRDGRERFGHGPGLCLRHLLAVLRAHPGPEAARFLLVGHSRRLLDVAADLRSYATKRDAFRRELITENEHEAWRRALALLAGERPLRDLEARPDGTPEE